MLLNQLKQPFGSLFGALTSFLPKSRLFTDPLHTLAYGTDASFYRLIPKIVIKAETAVEVSRILQLCASHSVPVTFRAAGTSLSGQALSDSVLLVLSGNAWKGISVTEGGGKVTLEPGVTGGEANRALQPFNRKIGPDPASIESAMIGGIAANNASGMCCGIRENSYQTVQGMKVILADGTLLDTQEDASREAFRKSHVRMLDELERLAAQVKADSELNTLIRRKYRIKNTMGYSLNALIDFTDPIDVLEHLMIGSEGTLGFIAEITYRTIPEPPFRAAALVSFLTLDNACQAVEELSKLTQIRAAELMDAASLKAVKAQCDAIGLRFYDLSTALRRPREPAHALGVAIHGAEPCALLVEVGGSTALEALQNSEKVERALKPFCESEAVQFFQDGSRIEQLWRVRKGLFPSVGALRKTGTSVIIEDVGFPQERLAQGARDLRGLLNAHGYDEAILFGHALSGNLHFVFTVDWAIPGETARYGHFMEALAGLVSGEYQGSLKSEHGTGRNMAPFVEREWGSAAYTVMQRIKAIFDPSGILNPGVILNSDPAVHLKNLKPLPAADPWVDACIECGFCEPVCPSRNLTLAPRQRIAVYREIKSLERSREDAARLHQLKEDFVYEGEQTCAADGLCSVHCPVGIDTGRLIKQLREKSLGRLPKAFGLWIARHFGISLAAARGLLAFSHSVKRVLGSKLIEQVSLLIHRITGGAIPRWHSFLPGSAARIKLTTSEENLPRVVYFPSCLSRIFSSSDKNGSLWQSVESLFKKAGYALVLPEGVDGLCCGLAFESKGHSQAGQIKLEELQKKIWEASQKGTDPVLFDTSPCYARFVEASSKQSWLGRLWEPAGFLIDKLAPHLKFKPSDEPLLMHVPCSAQKAGLRQAYKKAAALLSTQPRMLGEGCCGFAGDKGLNFPELTASAIQGLDGAQSPCNRGASASPTCELGLSSHTSTKFCSILKLADECSDFKH